MREALDPWFFVNASYVLAIVGTLTLVGWSWLAMRGAERRKNEARRK